MNLYHIITLSGYSSAIFFKSTGCSWSSELVKDESPAWSLTNEYTTLTFSSNNSSSFSTTAGTRGAFCLRAIVGVTRGTFCLCSSSVGPFKSFKYPPMFDWSKWGGILFRTSIPIVHIHYIDINAFADIPNPCRTQSSFLTRNRSKRLKFSPSVNWFNYAVKDSHLPNSLSSNRMETRLSVITFINLSALLDVILLPGNY